MILNEPTAALRLVSLRLLATDGSGLPLATVFVAGQVKIIKASGAPTNSVNLPVAVSGAVAGTFTLQLELTEVDTVGQLRIQISPTNGQYAEYVDEVRSSSTDAAAIATAVGTLVIDSSAPIGARTLAENINIIASFAASPSTGYPQSVIQTVTHKSLGGNKTRLKTSISGGSRVIDTIDGT